jgi:hypothetical protein
MKDTQLLDFTAKIVARYTKMCDACNKEMKGSVSNDHSLQTTQKDEDGNDNYKNMHFCSAACLKKGASSLKD